VTGGTLAVVMGAVIRFQKRSLTAVGKGKTLCRHGFHQWRIVTERRFYVKRGKPATLYRCGRCGTEKTGRRGR